MRKESKATQLIRMFHYWVGRLNLAKSIPIIKDNRCDCSVSLSEWDGKNICLVYHSRRLGQLEEFNLINTLFHEMGHYINKLPYNSYKQKIESEYQAEKFSVKMMKKYYPKLYKTMIDRMIERNYMKKLKKTDILYYNAYIKIKDYQKTL